MSKFIAFSGASHSGKTTLLKLIKDKYPNDVIIVGEYNEAEKINIDEIRKDPNKHFEFQHQAIYNKICEEISFFSKYENEKNKFVIFDRSMIDSYFYLTNYQDKINLTQEQKELYFQYEKYVRERMQEHIRNIYDYVFLFQPIEPKNINGGGFRTVDLNISQRYEYEMIKALTYYYCEPHCNIIHFAANELYNSFDSIYNMFKNK